MEARRPIKGGTVTVQMGLTAILAISVAVSLAGVATIYLTELSGSGPALRNSAVVASPTAGPGSSNQAIDQEGLVSAAPPTNKVGNSPQRLKPS